MSAFPGGAFGDGKHGTDCVLFQSNSNSWNSIRKVSLKKPRAARTKREKQEFLEGEIGILWEKTWIFRAKIPFFPLERHQPIPRHFTEESWSKESLVFAFWKMNLDAVIYLLPLIVWAVPNVNSSNFKSIEEEKLSKGSEIPSKFTLQIGSGRWDYAEDPQLTLPGKNAGTAAAFGRAEHLPGWRIGLGLEASGLELRREFFPARIGMPWNGIPREVMAGP